MVDWSRGDRAEVDARRRWLLVGDARRRALGAGLVLLLFVAAEAGLGAVWADGGDPRGGLLLASFTAPLLVAPAGAVAAAFLHPRDAELARGVVYATVLGTILAPAVACGAGALFFRAP